MTISATFVTWIGHAFDVLGEEDGRDAASDSGRIPPHRREHL